MKILLIDDDEELCAELKQVLDMEGFHVDVMFDGRRGLQHLQENPYHIIILDLKLPGLNGYSVLQAIRQTNKWLKVLVLSGRPLGEALLKEDGISEGDEEKILGMADLVINKPFMVDAFIQKVKALAVT